MISRRQTIIGGAVAIAGAGGVWSQVRRMGSMEAYSAAMATLRLPLPASPAAHDLIRFSTLAANSHNNQAWEFRAVGDTILIRPDLTRATPVVDPDNHHLFVSLGCAAENLSIAAASRGMPGETRFDAAAGELRFVPVKGAPFDGVLSDAIPLRQSTRSMFDGSTLTAVELDLLANAARIPGVDFILITDQSRISALSDLIATGNTAQINDQAFMAELKDWMRFNPCSALTSGDGLFAATTGNSNLPDWLGPTMVDLAFKAPGDNAKTAAKIVSSAGLAVFVGAREDAPSWVDVGRACQRFALQATAIGLKHAFLNQPVEVPELRAKLAELIGLPGRRPDIVMRFGRGTALPYSARRPVGEVMV